MASADEPWPDEGELLVCTVKNVRENGAYLNLDGYGSREGFVFIGEVASGWVKNIRNHLRVGQRVVAKVIGIKKDRERVDLSIKSVSEERRRDTLQSWKNNPIRIMNGKIFLMLYFKFLRLPVFWNPYEMSLMVDCLEGSPPSQNFVEFGY